MVTLTSSSVDFLATDFDFGVAFFSTAVLFVIFFFAFSSVLDFNNFDFVLDEALIVFFSAVFFATFFAGAFLAAFLTTFLAGVFFAGTFFAAFFTTAFFACAGFEEVFFTGLFLTAFLTTFLAAMSKIIYRISTKLCQTER
ncbi:MAG TPA: hypothetical protein PKH65_08245 [Bacteroidia bacterium]|nr:hypothetical protein [Bacteroidia bacterium]